MKTIEITEKILSNGAAIEQTLPDGYWLLLPKQGAGIDLTQIIEYHHRYLLFEMQADTDHSVPVNLLVYSNQEKSEKEIFSIRFGILPQIRTSICIDLHWMDAHILFPEHEKGQLKIVCHGRRVDRAEIKKILFQTLPSYHDIRLFLSPISLSDSPLKETTIANVKLIDEFGQYKKKEWKGKIKSIEQLKHKLSAQMQEVFDYPFDDWTLYGGWKKKKLTDGTGFFSKYKENGRWWLVDPDGYAFFSVGVDCVGTGIDCRIDGIESWIDALPKETDPVYRLMYRTAKPNDTKEYPNRTPKFFSFEQANLYRTFGEDWYQTWSIMIPGQLRRYGMNTLGNWSDSNLFKTSQMPYVTSLPHFPETKQMIFRDFPDVFSKEYQENAEEAAKALANRKEDPYMIGYFLRNEPAWAFVDHLILADEVLYNPARTCCKEKLIHWLEAKYKDIEQLNNAWNCHLSSFTVLYESQHNVSSWSAAAYQDMKEFSRMMLQEYIQIPANACRKVDPNHMILGMRWAWISDPDVITGWELFDVFSINCYAVDPTKAIQTIVDLNVDLPVMIGEFHFGALDAGPTATGLEGVVTQTDRGKAYRYYCERVAAHPYGVGCHYFQCYDQFALGRFDGENYNIGLFDICSIPYEEVMNAVKNCSRTIYPIAAKELEPTKEKAESIPMIAY